MDFYTNFYQQKNHALIIGYTNGKRVKKKVWLKPYLFVPSKKSTQYKNLKNEPVSRIDFDSAWDARSFYYKYKDVEGFTVYGSNRFEYVYIYDTFKSLEYNENLIKTCTIDIECSMEGGPPDFDSADKPITAITMLYEDVIFALGMGDFQTSDPKIKYIKCKDENELLLKFIRIWSSDVFMPDVVTGWNISGFDIPYIINRIIQVLGEDQAKKLSPWGILKPRQFEAYGRIINTFEIIGVNAIDYLDLYKKHILEPRERYSLDYISHVELDERKVDYSEYGNLQELYKNDHQKFMEYNIRDCELVQRLDKQLGLLATTFMFAYSNRINFIDTFGAVKSWDTKIHNHLMDQKIVIPPLDYHDGEERIIGAHVKDPKTGMFHWAISLDLASLYPSLIMAYNISPETLVGMLPLSLSHEQKVEQWLQGMPFEIANKIFNDGQALAANGALFSKKKQGFLPVLMEELFEQRKVFKKKMLQSKQKLKKIEQQIKDGTKGLTEQKDQLEQETTRYDNMQKIAKILLNSAYGICAQPGFRFFDRRLAEAITLGGQLTIQWAEKNINQFINYYLGTNNIDFIIASDTDSLYVNAEQIVQRSGLTDVQKITDFLDQFCEKQLQPILDKAYESLAQQMNCYKQSLYMKREAIAERAVFLAKKRYVLKLWDLEGVRFTEPEFKMMGIEAKRNSTPTAVRDAIEETFKLIINSDENTVQQYIAKFYDDYMKMPFEEIAKNSSLGSLEEYMDGNGFKSATPQHVKGAISYNKLLKQLNLANKYPMIFKKDKVKFCYLKEPNPTQLDVISAPGALPPQFDLDRYLDRNRQYEVTYLEPIRKVLDKIGWEVEKRTKVTSFFD